ncbi:methylmalonyl-CoA mutase family protein [Spirosoma areae]
MESHLPTLFPPADKSDWLAQVQKELKNEGIDEILRWQTGEGFTLEPYYISDELTALPLEAIQAAQKSFPGWLNAPEQRVSDEKTANATLRYALERGADALVIKLSASADLARLLNNIKLSETPVFFRFESGNGNTTEFIQSLKIVVPYQLKGGLLADMNDKTAEITRLTADSPLFRTVCVSSHAFHNAGATATQELAFTLSSLADMYDRLTDAGLSIDQLVPKTILSVSVGTSYFLEIAKLRALRVLYNRLLSHYPVSSIQHSVFIHAQTSTFYDSTATPYTNLLRATTESMAAVIGGCDVLTVHPYDTVLDESSEFSARIARNVSVLLKEESYLNKVADPSAGAYYIEILTNQFVESAWTLFLDVEKQGGSTKAFNNGYIPDTIEQAYQTKVEAVRNGKVLVGVTKFRVDEDANVNPKSRDTGRPEGDFIGLLPNRRLAGKFE